jgi:hypothetical protein
MFCLFNPKGELKTAIIIFKRDNPAKKWGKTYNVLGHVLRVGTYYDLEVMTKRGTEVIEIK